ncbi:MAG TPA: prepilin peptidase [Myxococcales bacterium]|jgi:leader peptidase (prepilin peptidase)/N-methyltransferase
MHPLNGIPLSMLTCFAFVFGAVVGSFLNVVIARVPFQQSIVWPPSHCMACGTPIKPFHNVPVLSWFWLRGRCRTCLAPFSIRYAGIEFLYGAVCALAVYRHGLSIPAAREILMMGFLVPLTFMDLDWWVLPRELTFSGVATGLVLAFVESWDVFQMRLLGAAVGWAGLMLVGYISERIVGREALGQGDPPLLGLIGAFLGPQALLPVLLLSSVQGVAVGIPMVLLRRRKEAKEPKPEEPTVAAAAQPPPEPEPEPVAGEKNPADDDDNWTPDPTAVPFGPFLSLAGAELLYFTQLPQYLFPWPF